MFKLLQTTKVEYIITVSLISHKMIKLKTIELGNLEVFSFQIFLRLTIWQSTVQPHLPDAAISYAFTAQRVYSMPMYSHPSQTLNHPCSTSPRLPCGYFLIYHENTLPPGGTDPDINLGVLEDFHKPSAEHRVCADRLRRQAAQTYLFGSTLTSTPTRSTARG